MLCDSRLSHVHNEASRPKGSVISARGRKGERSLTLDSLTTSSNVVPPLSSSVYQTSRIERSLGWRDSFNREPRWRVATSSAGPGKSHVDFTQKRAPRTSSQTYHGNHRLRRSARPARLDDLCVKGSRITSPSWPEAPGRHPQWLSLSSHISLLFSYRSPHLKSLTQQTPAPLARMRFASVFALSLLSGVAQAKFAFLDSHWENQSPAHPTNTSVNSNGALLHQAPAKRL